jgi:hypothetical protein
VDIRAAALVAIVAVAVVPQPIRAASDVSGRVLFNSVAVPGATVTVAPLSTPPGTGTDRTMTTLSDDTGAFRFSNLDDGAWTIRVEMRGFVTMTRDIAVPVTETAAASLSFSLTMRPYQELVSPKPSPDLAAPPDSPVSPAAPAVMVQSASPDDPGIINGSSINGAASVYAQPRAFGNNRPRINALYTGGFSATLGNSAWNATPFSFGGTAAPLPSYGDAQLGFTIGGPLKIPGLIKNGPQTVFIYQHGVQHNATTESAVMPTAAERAGDFSQLFTQVRDPLTGQPFAGNIIPSNRISPQAAALLAYYPLPNTTTTTGANYQEAVVSATTTDNVQTSMSKNLSNRTTLSGSFAFQRTLTDSVNLFDFTDTSRQSSVTAGLNWTRRFNPRFQVRLQYRFSRAASDVTPFFANRTNVSGDAGIVGNSQNAVDWGPPSLSFSDIAGLSDGEYQHSLKLAHAGGAEASWRRGRQNITFGGDLRRNHFDVSSQPDPRGTLSFTGAATGNAVADFLLGLPTTSAIGFGNTDARLRDSAYDAYITDDFRVSAGLTLNLGARWEYEAPFTEASGRLVNLDVAPNFSATSPVLATNPVGSLTGTSYPTSLVRPDKRGFEPRVATSWRPLLGSSLVFRGSYGLYRNLGVYQPLALLLAQQPPFTKTVSVQNTALTPLTLANPFSSFFSNTNTFAVDPNFRSGYAHAWQASMQSDLPASLTAIVQYDGSKGSHLMQASLPNTYPAGAVNPCGSCPAGFVYVTSNGTSLRNAVQFTLRRRLHSGLMASVQYTLSKSTDDAATFNTGTITPGSLAIAQDWLNLGAERAPSSFDQRHLVSAQGQYTTGQGIAGGTLVDGFWGTLFKDWTVTSQLSRGSGLPFTPISFAAVTGTGIVGVRPALTGVTTTPAAGAYANPAAYTAPSPGTWGDAGRNSLRGPAQFSLNASVARVFRLRGRLNLEWTVAATNVLNRVTFATVDPVITSPQFGLPTVANSMRRLQVTARLRF